MYRNVSHTAACGAFSSKNVDFKSVIVRIILLAHSNERTWRINLRIMHETGTSRRLQVSPQTVSCWFGLTCFSQRAVNGGFRSQKTMYCRCARPTGRTGKCTWASEKANISMLTYFPSAQHHTLAWADAKQLPVKMIGGKFAAGRMLRLSPGRNTS